VKFAIIGSGAVGGYFGARLHEAGHTVYFLARGSHLEAIRKNGLQIKSVAGDYKALNVETHETVQTIPSVDVVLVAVKAWQVSEIAPKLKSLAKGSTYFVPLQNGVEAHGILEEVLGKERVLGGLCGLISFIEKPGVIQHAGAEPYVTIGEYYGQSSPRTKALQEAFSPCIGAKANISDDIKKSIWEKFLLISAFSGVGAVTRVPIGIIRSIPETRKLLDDALKEVIQLANARGVKLDQKSLKKHGNFSIIYQRKEPPPCNATSWMENPPNWNPKPAPLFVMEKSPMCPPQSIPSSITHYCQLKKLLEVYSI